MGSVKRVLSVFFVLHLFINSGITDEKWENFKAESQKYYYYLEQTEVQNFTCRFTTNTYINFIQEQADSSYTYPLKFIWTRAGKIYYVLETYPSPADSNQREQILGKIQLTKGQFQGFYLDWLNFLIVSPLEDIPGNSSILFKADTVQVIYTNEEAGKSVRVTKIFSRSGKLMKVVVEYGSEKIVNHPKYTEADNKWICTGWNTQIYRSGKITSGLATRLELHKVQGNWMPIQADILVQTAEKPQDKYLSTIFIKDYIFNAPLQEIELPQHSSGTDSEK